MTHEIDRPDKAKWRIKTWHVLLVLVALLIAAVVFLQWRWKSEFARRIAALAAAGYPVTPEELDASYAWPESGENGADLVIGAGSYLVELHPDDARHLLKSVGGVNHQGVTAIPPEKRELLRQHVQANAKARELLHRCATVKESRYPIELSEGLMVSIPWLGDVRKCCLLLCYEAIDCAEREDPDVEEAIRAIEAGFGVARTLRNEPVFISQLVYLSLFRHCTQTMERLVCRCHLTEEQLGRLDQCLSRIDVPEAIRRGMESSQCLNLGFFVDPGSIDGEVFPEFPREEVVTVYTALGLAAREGVVFLDLMAECLAVSQRPTHERRQPAAAIEKRFNELSKSHLLLKHVSPPWYLLKLETRCLARLRCAEMALAVERSRLARGRLPETLAELVPGFTDSVPEDPYDGAALRYMRVEGGFVVYSVGENGLDEVETGALTRDDGGAEKFDDIAFSVER